MLESDRLRLTPLCLDELMAIDSGAMDTVDTPIEASALSGTVQSAIQKKIVKMRSTETALHDWFTYWLIVDKATGQGIGFIGFKGIEETGYVEVGYGISPNYRRQGLMSEALQMLIGWAQQHPGIKGVTAKHVLKTNIGSNGVLRHCGFELISSSDTENGYCYKFGI